MDKKKIAVAFVVLFTLLGAVCCGAAVFGYSTPSAEAKLVGNTPEECEAGCAQPCFCNRSCFLAWCWGDYYCQCDND